MNEIFFSAIDFVVAENRVEELIQSMSIDEEGLLKIQGKKFTDHNTIVVNIEINNTSC